MAPQVDFGVNVNTRCPVIYPEHYPAPVLSTWIFCSPTWLARSRAQLERRNEGTPSRRALRICSAPKCV